MKAYNDHNVYIFGAGFSHAAGLPLVSEFFDRMRDSHPWLVSKNRQKEADAVDQILRFRLAAASAAYWINLDLDNIEHLFSLAILSGEGSEPRMQTAIAATLDFALSTAPPRTCQVYIGDRPWVNQHRCFVQVSGTNDHQADIAASGVAALLGFYESGHAIGQNTFITFNYDTLLEDALHLLDIPFGYNLGQDGVTLDGSSKSVNDPDAIKVLKLHGSVNWVRQEEKESLKIYGNYSDVWPVNAAPALIPPTWRKYPQSPLTSAWASAIESLQTATRMVVVGYSMPPADLHFRYLLAAGLKENVSLRKVLFLDKDTDKINRRSHEYFLKQHIKLGRVQVPRERVSCPELFTNREVMKDIGRPVPSDVHFRELA